MPVPDQENNRPASNDSLIVHVIQAMPLHVVLSVLFVAVFFFWGAAASGLNFFGRLAGRPALVLDPTAGLLIGALGALILAILIWRIKKRPR